MEHPDCGAEEREQKEEVVGCLGRLTLRNREGQLCTRLRHPVSRPGLQGGSGNLLTSLSLSTPSQPWGHHSHPTQGRVRVNPMSPANGGHRSLAHSRRSPRHTSVTVSPCESALLFQTPVHRTQPTLCQCGLADSIHSMARCVLGTDDPRGTASSSLFIQCSYKGS